MVIYKYHNDAFLQRLFFPFFLRRKMLSLMTFTTKNQRQSRHKHKGSFINGFQDLEGRVGLCLYDKLFQNNFFA